MCGKGTCGGGEEDSWSAVYFVISGDALDELVHSTPCPGTEYGVQLDELSSQWSNDRFYGCTRFSSTIGPPVPVGSTNSTPLFPIYHFSSASKVHDTIKMRYMKRELSGGGAEKERYPRGPLLSTAGTVP